jgi:hypothetical protein
MTGNAPIKNTPADDSTAKATRADRKRIPMSTPQQKLAVKDIVGYSLYWILDARVPQAMAAGYEFVDAEEVDLNQVNVANDAAVSGNADLGSRVKIPSGAGSPEYLNLMKIRQDFRDEDQATIDKKEAQLLSGIFRHEQIMDGNHQVSAEDKRTRYVKKALFQRPARKGNPQTKVIE